MLIIMILLLLLLLVVVFVIVITVSSMIVIVNITIDTDTDSMSIAMTIIRSSITGCADSMSASSFWHYHSGIFASQDFGICLLKLCGSFAENRGDSRRRHSPM